MRYNQEAYTKLCQGKADHPLPFTRQSYQNQTKFPTKLIVITFEGSNFLS